MPKEKMVALLSGRNRHVYLYPWVVLEGADVNSDVKLTETKGCQAMTIGTLRPGGPACLLAGVKRQVICYEITRIKPYHRKLWEVQAPGTRPVAGYYSWSAVRGLPFGLRSAGHAGGVVTGESGEPRRSLASLFGPAATGCTARNGGGGQWTAAVLQSAGSVRGRDGTALSNAGADVALRTTCLQ